MKGLNKFLGMSVLTGSLLMTASCVTSPNDYGRNDRNHHPPPHSANNGYRQKYNGHEVRYDAHLGVYKVVGKRNYYYLDNQYYRYDRKRWYSSQHVDRGWRDYDERRLPPGLAKKYARKDKHHDRKHNDRDH